MYCTCSEIFISHASSDISKYRRFSAFGISDQETRITMSQLAHIALGNKKELVARIEARLGEIARRDPETYIKSPGGDPESYYWCSVLVEEGSGEPRDAVVRDGLKKSLLGETRLSNQSQPELFQDALLRYARLHIKYRQWGAALNLLMLADQLGKEMPGWVSNYQAKLLYETAPERAFDSPEHVLEKLMHGASQPEFHQHAISIFRDYLETARERIVNSTPGEPARERLQDFRKRVRIYLDGRKTQRGALQGSLGLASTQPDQGHQVSESLAIYPLAPQDSPGNAEILGLRSTITKLEQTIDDLTIENIKLYGDIDELQKQLDNFAERDGEEGLVVRERTAPESIGKLKVAVLGAMQIPQKNLLGIVKRFGLGRSNIEFFDYDQTKRLSIDGWEFNCPYSGILIGPVPHSTKGAGHYSSVVERLTREGSGFPPTIVVRTKAGGLKITNDSFKSALSSLLDKIGSVDPELATN